jgi:hypothetical protein
MSEQTNTPERGQWEYITLTILRQNDGNWHVDKHNGQAPYTPSGLQDADVLHTYLGLLGKDGWEVCAALSTEGTGTMILKKRV